jgi:hypothetical protein
MAEIVKADTKKRGVALSLTAVLAGTAILSVGIALLAIFTLADWAEASVLNHAVQHVLIFLAGLGFGTSMLSIYAEKGKEK